MSAKVNTIFAIRDMKIMEDTLNKLGHKFTKSKDTLSIQRSWYNIEINAKGISNAVEHSKEVEKIKYEYGKAQAISNLQRDGSLYTMEETNTELTILVN